MVHVEKVAYGGWPNCYKMSNDIVDLVVTTDVGPRVMRFGFVGQHNELKEYPGEMGKTGGDEWRLYGGHRFWHAPEQQPRTYLPDNAPVALTEIYGGVKIVQPVELQTGIQKQLEIHMASDAARVTLTHRLVNQGMWTVELAAWALTVMRTGGVAILPMPPRKRHEDGALQPANTLSLWPYTNMADPRWMWGHRYIMLRQDISAETPQKVGAAIPDGWIAYACQNHLFVKTAPYEAGAIYPDGGTNVQTFTNSDMLEVETLGPMTRLAPGEELEYRETWALHDNVPTPQLETDIDKHVISLVRPKKA